MRAHVLAITVATLSCLALATILVPVSGAATSQNLVISNASANPEVPFQDFQGNPVKLFDIDRDGQLEIIAQNDNQNVYVFDSKTGAMLSELTTSFPGGWEAKSFNGPEAGFMTGDDDGRIIVANSAAYITSYSYDPGASSPGSHLAFTKDWERRLTDCFQFPGMDAKPVLVDLDKDGSLEIVAVTEETGVYALRADGTIFWKQCIGGGNAEPGIGDLNQDGYPDVVQGSDGGIIHALNGRTGGFLWSYDILADFEIGSASMPVAATVAQLDGLKGPDVIVGARDSHDPVVWSNDRALLLAVDSEGKLLWGRQDSQGNPLTYTRPIVVDAANDGTPEIYWGDWNTIGHKPPAVEADAWTRTGAANFYRYDNNGNMVWRQSLETWWSNKDLALGDVDGDGVHEVLVNGPGAGGDGIYYLDSNNGAVENFVSTSPWKVSRAPVLGDLWDTGTMQYVVQVQAMDNNGGGILVYDTGAPFSVPISRTYVVIPPPATTPPVAPNTTEPLPSDNVTISETINETFETIPPVNDKVDPQDAPRARPADGDSKGIPSLPVVLAILVVVFVAVRLPHMSGRGKS